MTTQATGAIRGRPQKYAIPNGPIAKTVSHTSCAVGSLAGLASIQPLRGRILQQAQEMLCVLVEILGRNGVAPGSGFAGKCQVAVMAFQRIGGSVVVAAAPGCSRIVPLVRR
jgi:hypothetical protein